MQNLIYVFKICLGCSSKVVRISNSSDHYAGVQPKEKFLKRKNKIYKRTEALTKLELWSNASSTPSFLTLSCILWVKIAAAKNTNYFKEVAVPLLLEAFPVDSAYSVKISIWFRKEYWGCSRTLPVVLNFLKENNIGGKWKHMSLIYTEPSVATLNT